MIRSLLAPALAAIGLTSCVSLQTRPGDIGNLAIGQSAMAGPVAIRPVTVREDSRCPAGVQCVTAGRVRVDVSIVESGAASVREMVAGQPLAVPGGTLTITDVRPARPNGTIAPSQYRFSFAFSPAG